MPDAQIAAIGDDEELVARANRTYRSRRRASWPQRLRLGRAIR